MELKINRTHFSQKDLILDLYKAVSVLEDGLIRRTNEVDADYIEGFLSRSLKNGLSLVAQEGDLVRGEIHAYTPDIFAFQHILTDLTIAVHPDFHGKGIGRQLFDHFLGVVKNGMPHIHRIELYTREHNKRNVQFYESLGFINEGRQKQKIFKGNNAFETPLHMAWLRGTP